MDTPLTTSACSTQWPALLLPLRLEARRVNNDLCIRVFPDQPFVNTHKEALSAEEAAAGEQLRAIVATDGWQSSHLEDARGQWVELARRYGPARAAWILQSLLNGGSTSVNDEAAVPTLFLLPQRFQFMVYENEQLVYNEPGRDLAGPYTLLPAPSPTPPEEEAPPTDGLFDESSKWVTNFDAAVTRGLAIRIPLVLRHAVAQEIRFSEIVVLGLTSGDQNTGLQAFEQFVATHRYSDGFEFLRYSTPTNTTQQAESGHSESEDELLKSFDVEVAPPAPRVDTVADELAKALGLSPTTEVFKSIKGADLAPHPPLRLLIDTLWPCTGDYFFSEMLGYQPFAVERTRLRQYVREYLRPGGHFAALRVGNMPYGVLPATRTKPASSQDQSGWDPSPVDHQASGASGSSRSFDDAMLRVLRAWLPLWLARAKNAGAVPRAGSSADPDDELIRLLGMSPHSLDCSARPVVDQTLILVLYRMFQDTLFGVNSSFEEFFNAARADPPRKPDPRQPDPPGKPGRDIETTKGPIHVAGRDQTRWVTGVDSRTAAGAWGYAWQQSWEGRRGLYQGLGIGAHLKYYPPLLRTFMWGEGVPCGMDLVRVPIPPVVAGGTPAEPAVVDGPEIYLPLFLSGPPPSRTASKTLLFDLLRRSLALEPQLPVTMRDVTSSFAKLRDYPIVEFFSHTGSREALEALAARDPVIAEDLTPAVNALHKPYNDAVTVRNEFGPDAGELFDAIAPRLRFDFTETLENGLRNVIDALTSRLDAWWTSLAARRLAGMRAANPPGLHWGAYGYLEDLKLAKHDPNVVEREGGGGYIHAPTIGQATAAALLRNSYRAHRNDPDGNAYAMNLTSRRVNRALALIDGVQQGQDLPALLGYQFERGLHDAGLDRAIDAFRKGFPVSPPDDEDKAEASEAIGARDVCDGRALANASTSDPRIEAALASLDVASSSASAEARAEARDLIKDLRDANDAVGDLLLYEGIYQAVQGNVERSGAALDAWAGKGRPPEIESVATPATGPNLRHRVCLFVPCDDSTAAPGPRAAAEPRLANWVDSVLGPLANITCFARFTPADDQVGEHFVSLADLAEVSALDFVYMSHTLPGGDGDTEIETRLRRRVRQLRAVATGSIIELRLDDALPGTRSVAHALEVGRSLLDLLGNVTVVTPANVTRPDDAPPPPFHTEDEVDALLGRARDAKMLLAVQAALLESSDSATQRDALDRCTRFGISEAVIERDDDPSISERAKSVLAIVTKREAAAAALLDATATGDARVDAAVDALKALFGESFVVLPACDASGIAADKRAEFGAALPRDPGEGRVWLWLQQVAETHPRVRRLETFLIAAEAWGVMTPSLSLAQLPREPDLEWQGLADDEMITIQHVPGVQSIVALTPAALDSSCLAGFVVDEWTETMPASGTATGISFEYDQPASQAPQCFLLAVPGNFDQPEWTAEHLAGIVRETMDLAKVRLVDLDAMPNVGGLAPALMFPIPPAPIQHHVEPGFFINAVP